VSARLRIVSINDVYSLLALPRLATLIAEARAVQPADLLLVTVAGDFLAPSLLSSLDGGRGMAEAMDALGVHYVTLGNHEDDLSFPDLTARLAGLGATIVVSNAADLTLRHVPDAVVEVKGHRVGLIGLVEGEPSLFRKPPFGGSILLDPLPSAERAAARLREAGCCAIVALTHQRLATDRALARLGVVDLICGGHEHEGYLELEHGTPLAKAAQNAASALVADLILHRGEPAEVSVRLVPTSGHAEEPAMRALVERILAPVMELEKRVLFRIPEGETLSSAGSRLGETSLGTKVCSGLRDAFDADAAIFNGGGLRGPAPHVREFSYADLRDELPFENEVVVVHLPGAVLRDAVRYARERLRASGGFLHLDDRARVSPAHELEVLAGAPLDPERSYAVALVRDLLLGMDRIEPLLAHVAVHPELVPPPASGQEGKVALLRAWSGPT
jgi:2',3'-cyclic-nucleotide 2'-phosphodiesterase (5'-nucleotidase family)